MNKYRVMMVCLGNICRSPMAEAIFRDLANKQNLDCEVQSSGTTSYHIGSNADSRTLKTLADYDLSLQHSAQQFSRCHFAEFDYIFAMDKQNYRDILSLALNKKDTKKVFLLRDFDNQKDSMNIPDPYYGGENGFEYIYQIIMRACQNIVNQIKKNGQLNKLS